MWQRTFRTRDIIAVIITLAAIIVTVKSSGKNDDKFFQLANLILGGYLGQLLPTQKE